MECLLIDFRGSVNDSLLSTEHRKVQGDIGIGMHISVYLRLPSSLGFCID